MTNPLGPAQRRSVAWVAMIGVTVCTALMGLVHFVNMTFDDAFISFRYAENLASGRGLVFNVGERVEGYSNFLWTVLLALPAWLGAGRHEFGMLFVAKGAGVVCALATLLLAVCTAEAGRQPAERRAVPIAAMHLALCASFLAWSDGGLETPLVTLLLLATVYFATRELSDDTAGGARIQWSAVTLALAALTRPEPVVLLVPLVILRVAVHGRGRWRSHARYVLRFAAPYALFLTFRVVYYGQLLPNTYYAKRSGDPEAFARGLAYLGYANTDLALIEVVLVAGLLIVLARRVTRRVALLGAVFVAHCIGVVYEGGDWMPANRLLVPVLPILALIAHEAWLAAASLEWSHFVFRPVPNWIVRDDWQTRYRAAIERAATRFGERGRALLRAAGRVAVGMVVAFASFRSFGPWIGVPGSGFGGLHFDQGPHFQVARWMQRHVHDGGLLAIGEAGVIPYYTRLPTLDLFGLMDPHIGRLPGVRHVKFDADYVLARRPRYVVLTVIRDARGRLTPTQPHGEALLARADFVRDYSILRVFDGAVLFIRGRSPSAALR